MSGKQRSKFIGTSTEEIDKALNHYLNGVGPDYNLH